MVAFPVPTTALLISRGEYSAILISFKAAARKRGDIRLGIKGKQPLSSLHHVWGMEVSTQHFSVWDVHALAVEQKGLGVAIEDPLKLLRGGGVRRAAEAGGAGGDAGHAA